MTISSAFLFQHSRELAQPKDAKSWFLITPGQGGKIVCIGVLEDGASEKGVKVGQAATCEAGAERATLATAAG